MKLFRLLAALPLAFLSFTVMAFAATVEIPVHETLNAVHGFLIDVGIPVAGGLLMLAARSIPYGLGAMLKRQQVEQALKWAVEFGVQHALKAAPEKIDIEVRNLIAATALNYAIKHTPAWLQEWMGGTDMIREKIEARINATLSDHGISAVPLIPQ